MLRSEPSAHAAAVSCVHVDGRESNARQPQREHLLAVANQQDVADQHLVIPG